MQNLYMPASGLHIWPPQFVAPAPPSAFTAVGVTKVLRNRTTDPRTSNIRFMSNSFKFVNWGRTVIVSWFPRFCNRSEEQGFVRNLNKMSLKSALQDVKETTLSAVSG